VQFRSRSVATRNSEFARIMPCAGQLIGDLNQEFDSTRVNHREPLKLHHFW
jgi:hypothetical protein